LPGEGAQLSENASFSTGYFFEDDQYKIIASDEVLSRTH
jgi:hypothetical protein